MDDIIVHSLIDGKYIASFRSHVRTENLIKVLHREKEIFLKW